MPAPGWYSWGQNFNGCLGVGDTSARIQTPTAMLVIPPTADLRVGVLQGMALVGGQLYAWGSNSFGGLGLASSFTTVSTPQLVPSFGSVAQHGVADGWAGALLDDGTLWFTGRNDQGQFGNGSFTGTGHFGFVQTSSPGPTTISRLIVHDNITSLFDPSGHVWMAGFRGSNRIPDGITSPTSPTRYTTFFQCTLLTPPILDVAMAGDTGLALYADHTVYVWGDISHGKDGSGVNRPTGTRTPTPQQVPGLSSIMAIAATNEQLFALKSDSTLWTWGDNALIEGGIAGASADSGDPILSPTRWSNATSLTVAQIGRLTPYVYTALCLGTDNRRYGAGENNQTQTGLICRLAEQPSGTSTWTSVPGPTHGYPEFDPVVGALQIRQMLVMAENATFVQYFAPLAAGVNQVSIVG